MIEGGSVQEAPRAMIDVEADFGDLIRKQFPDQAHYGTNGEVLYKAANEEGYLLGNPELPVAAYRELIIETVKDNLITIVTSGTGTGKSTNIPQYLFESGVFERVIATQPRVVAARGLKAYVASDIEKSLRDPHHNLVGYQTAVESDLSDDNAILNVTDGLQLMHEIYKNGVQPNQVLIIDEFHERSKNMDTLLAIAVHYGIRVVVMSATLDATRLSEFYGNVIGTEVPIIDVPGETFPVTERLSDNLDEEVIKAAINGKNVLVFLPGRQEITAAMGRMRRRVSPNYTLLALYGDQTPDQQSKALDNYPGGKIIFSTAVGQTSITIEDIDVVIDCGYARTEALDEHGKSTLATVSSSMATADQRRGRVGRTHAGEYILAQLKGYPPIVYGTARDAYDVPEIRRTRLDDLILKLAAIGHTIDSLPFFEKPDLIEIERAERRLARLGFIQQSLGETAVTLTISGEKAAKLPLDTHSARMILESRQYGKDVELQMLAGVAVRQINGITSTVKGLESWRKLTKENSADIIAGIDFMYEALRRTESEQAQENIVKLRYDKALRSFEQLAKRRGLDYANLKKPTIKQREALLRSIVAGTDELFVKSGRLYMDDHHKRRKNVDSTIIGQGEELLVGSAFNLQQARTKMIATHALITGASAVSIKLLMDVLPDRVSTMIKKLYIDENGTPMTNQVIVFDDFITSHEVTVEAEASPALQRFIVERIFSTKQLDGSHGPNIREVRRTIHEMRRLQHRTAEDLGVDYSITKIIQSMMHEINHMSKSFDDIDPFLDIQAVRDIIPDSMRQEIINNAPDSITVVHEGHALKYHVNYYDNNARITIPPYYYHLLPFTIGNGHRVRVRPSESVTHYVALEDARDAYEAKAKLPNRESRRGNANTGGIVTPVKPRLNDQRNRNITPRKR